MGRIRVKEGRAREGRGGETALVGCEIKQYEFRHYTGKGRRQTDTDRDKGTVKAE